MTPLPPGVRDVGELRILLVEDDAGDALLVEELLFDTDLAHTLVQCRSMAEARAELTARPADCVLLDLHLPDVSGLETIDAVRGTGTEAAVIVLTGLAESHAGVEAPPRARRTTSSRARSIPNCCSARSATPSSASSPNSPGSPCTRAGCAPRRTRAWNAVCCPCRCSDHPA